MLPVLAHLTLFRPHLWGEELYAQMGFFCSVNFGRSIYSSQGNVSGIIKKLIQRRIQNSKEFFHFCFFFSRSYRGLKFCVNTGYLFTFSDFSSNYDIFYKNSISNFNFLPKNEPIL